MHELVIYRCWERLASYIFTTCNLHTHFISNWYRPAPPPPPPAGFSFELLYCTWKKFFLKKHPTPFCFIITNIHELYEFLFYLGIFFCPFLSNGKGKKACCFWNELRMLAIEFSPTTTTNNNSRPQKAQSRK